MTRPAIFITGAAAGIGRATAELFAGRGWRVGLYDVDLPAVETLSATLGETAICGRLDVRERDGFDEALRAFSAFSGDRLDVMFNNAGVLSVGHFEDIPDERHSMLVDVNFKGVIHGCEAALPYLRRTKAARVINMSSASAIYGAPSFASYSATKFAVKGLTEALDIEWARYGVRVMDVLPLFVNTAMVHDIEKPTSVGRLGVRLQAGDIATTVWRAANWNGRRRVHWYPGWQSRAMALSDKLAPAPVTRLAMRLLSGY